MCIDFEPVSKQQLAEDFEVEPPQGEWPAEVWQDYSAPFLIHQGGARVALLGSYGFVPQDKKPAGVKRLTTMNARDDTIGVRRNYKMYWQTSQLCIVPAVSFFEPNYESGKHERWRIHLADNRPFGIAGMWRSWHLPGEEPQYSFTQITVNADDHPFMKRFHQPGEEKRGLVILHQNDYDEWLACKNPEMARAFLQLYPAELMAGEPKAAPPRKKKEKSIAANPQTELF